MPSAVDDAIASLDAGPARTCSQLILSGAAACVSIAEAGHAGSTVACCDGFGPIAPMLRDALTTSSPFAALWEGLNAACSPDPLVGVPGQPRLLQQLVHRLADGAAVVVVCAPTHELQIVASRALLDAKCEVLLTHEVPSRTN